MKFGFYQPYSVGPTFQMGGIEAKIFGKMADSLSYLYLAAFFESTVKKYLLINSLIICYEVT